MSKDEASEWLVFLLVSLSARPRQNSTLLPFHETHAWSAAVFHAIYHYSDETGPYTQSKKGFLRHLAGILWQSLACITSMTAWPSDSKIQTVARKPAAVAIFPSGRARNVLDRCGVRARARARVCVCVCACVSR